MSFSSFYNRYFSEKYNVKNKVSILPIICALNACVHDVSNDNAHLFTKQIFFQECCCEVSNSNDNGITKSSVDEAIEYIRQNATLTDNTSRRWFKIIYRNKSNKADLPGALFTIISIFRPNY